MSKNLKRNPRRTALRDLRLLTSTLSLTAIIGLWNLFSRQAQQDVANAELDALVNAGSATIGEDGLPPLPTLVPMDDALILPNDLKASGQTEEGSTTQLREVTAPTPVIIQNKPPVVESVVIGQQPADSGGSSAKPKPSAKTGSSK